MYKYNDSTERDDVLLDKTTKRSDYIIVYDHYTFFDMKRKAC